MSRVLTFLSSVLTQWAWAVGGAVAVVASFVYKIWWPGKPVPSYVLRTLCVLFLIVALYNVWDAQYRENIALRADSTAEQIRLNSWAESVKELRPLYQKLLHASAGNRPLIQPYYYTLFDSLRLACGPIVKEPSRRLHRYLVQLAATARHMGKHRPAILELYLPCWTLAERLAGLELSSPPVRMDSFSAVVRAFREYCAPNQTVEGISGLAQKRDSASLMYVDSDSGLLALVRTTARHAQVSFRTSLRGIDPQRYDAVVVNGAVCPQDTSIPRSLVSQGVGLVLSGKTPSLLVDSSSQTDTNRYLGPIADWMGADFLLETWGSDVTPSASRLLDYKTDSCVDLDGPPEWSGDMHVLLPVGLGPRTVAVGWCSDDIAVFSAAVLPDSAHPGRVYYQGSLGEGRFPQLESLYVSGIRWAAGLLQLPGQGVGESR